ncbi:MAG: cytochrome c oxidase subunit II [Acidimicrobiales bacterium]|nr:cytochrome c oxidase subunit II [Acidimicrobiales bacterium]MCB9373464.1 cytochrome c oxidase subunit II [Microthrixaceae bacterium]
MRRLGGPRRGATVPVLAVAGAALLAGCSGNLGAPEAVTEQGQEFTALWKGFLLTAAVIGLLVYGLILYAAFRYRRRKGDDPAKVPSQFQYQVPLEVLYTVVPVLIVAVLFGVTVVAQDRITRTSPDPDLTVRVEGFQWQWQFLYVDEGVNVAGSAETTPELVLPVGRDIRFDLVSDDVNHSFWVPEFLEKRDLIPGVDNEIDITLTEAGEWVGRCAEYCGLDHWKMDFTVRAVPGDEFDAWLADQQAGRAAGGGS